MQKGHQSIFTINTKPLFISGEEYDGEALGLQSFITAMMTRSLQAGWSFDLPLKPLNPADEDDWDQRPKEELKNFLQHYGMFSESTLRAFGESQVIPKKSRANQNNHQQCQCVYASLTKAAINKISCWSTDYHVNGVPYAPLMVKVIIREAHIVSQSAIRILREELSSLDKYMMTIGSDITKFNAYVNSKLIALQAQGETTQDLLPNLFKGYKNSSDKNFVQYIQGKQNDYDNGSTTIDAPKLMHLANEKYKTMVTEGEWNAPSLEQEKIIALQTQIDALKGEWTPTGGKKTKKTKGRRDREKPAWMTTHTGDTKTVRGKKYLWCAKHKSYGKHSTSECKGQGLEKDEEQEEEGDTSASEPAKEQNGLRLSAAHQALLDERED